MQQLRPSPQASWMSIIVTMAGVVGVAIGAVSRADEPAPASESGPSERIVLTSGAESSSTGEIETGSSGTEKVRVEIVERGTSAASTRKGAIAALPLDKLDRKQKELVEDILRSESLYRRLPTISFGTDPEVYAFFAAHPDVAVSIWRALKISDVEMWQTAAHEFEADAKDGSVGVIQVLHHGREQNLIICDGVFKTPVLPKPIRGRALMHLQTRYTKDENQQTYVTHNVDLFVAFPSTTVETAAKLISPVSNMIADRNFREISLFVRMMAVAMENQPGWVERVADRLEGVLPDRKTQLLKLTAQVYIEARKRQLAAEKEGSAGVSLEEIIGPLRAAPKRPEQSPRVVLQSRESGGANSDFLQPVPRSVNSPPAPMNPLGE